MIIGITKGLTAWLQEEPRKNRKMREQQAKENEVKMTEENNGIHK